MDIRSFIRQIVPDKILDIKRHIQWRKRYVLDHHRVILKRCCGGIIIDCGANVGNSALVFSKFGSLVYCFEPHPGAYKKLSEVASKLDNIKIYNLAVSDHDGAEDLYFHHSSLDDFDTAFSNGTSLVMDKADIDVNRHIVIKTIRLSDFIFKINNHISLLKIDIEGHEPEVVIDLINSGAINQVGCVFMETHERFGASIAEKVRIMNRLIISNSLENKFIKW